MMYEDDPALFHIAPPSGPSWRKQPTVFTTPVTRNTDPATSHDAAASVSGVSRTQRRILHLLADLGPATDETLAYRWVSAGYGPMSPSGLRSRRADLVRGGLVEAAGTGTLSTGRKATRWAITDAGRRRA